MTNPAALAARVGRHRRSRRHLAWLALGIALPLLGAAPAFAQRRPAIQQQDDEQLVQLDFNNAELTDIIDTISSMTNRNFIYDERVRGKVTIKSPTRISVDQAYAVFESVLQVKGFTTVETPGGALKIIPVRDAKETNVETLSTHRAPPNVDRYVTRLIPLKYVEAEPIVNTLKPLVSKDANIAAYAPTNTVILTEAASNIRRVLAILEAIDVESNKEELAMFKIEHADAGTLASQISEIYGAEVTAPAATARRGRASRRASAAAATPTPTPGPVGTKVRLITDARTNSIIALAPVEQLADVRNLVRRLDIPASGGGRIHVYYLQHADSEELAQTLSSLVSGRAAPRATGAAAAGAAATGGGAAQALRAAVSGLAGGINITADPATNALVIQASKEGYDTVVSVIEMLDVERPQVLVEALIMEVDISDSEQLGFTGLIRFINGDTEFSTVIAPRAAEGFALGGPIGAAVAGGAPLITRMLQDTLDDTDGDGIGDSGNGHVIDAIIRASAGDSGTNIISAPHILTMDNEEAEIRIGQNIPIITNRVQSAAGVVGSNDNLATSVNVERQDIGVTLRVTPQITEGDSLRMNIFQEISAINVGLTASGALGDPADVGVPLSNRQIENVVVVRDGETVVIGGLLSDEYQDTVSKVPFLGDIPILGWAFKSSERELRKINLLIFLTPYIIRSPQDLEYETIRTREEFAKSSAEGLDWSDRERAAEEKRRKKAEEAGEPYEPHGDNPVRNKVLEHSGRYPEERLDDILEEEEAAAAESERNRLAALTAPQYAVHALVQGGEAAAMQALQEVIDAGHDGTLSARDSDGQVFFELQLGPYATIDEAQSVGTSVSGTHGLVPSVVVVPRAVDDSNELE